MMMRTKVGLAALAVAAVLGVSVMDAQRGGGTAGAGAQAGPRQGGAGEQPVGRGDIPAHALVGRRDVPEVALSRGRRGVRRSRRHEDEGLHQRDYGVLSEEPRRWQSVLGPDHRFALRQDDHRLGRGAVQAHRARASPRAAVHPEAAAVVADVVGGLVRWRRQDRRAQDGVPAVPLGRHQRNGGSRCRVGGHGHGCRLPGARRARQGRDRLRLPEPGRPRGYGAHLRHGAPRGRRGRGGADHRARLPRQRDERTDGRGHHRSRRRCRSS